MIKVIMKILKKIRKSDNKIFNSIQASWQIRLIFCKGLLKGILKFASILTSLDEDLRLL